ncbi:MAG TPA: tetratricopeptide repeat protein [Chloroflexi bacterium]|nr:tetratricopeptide repeat protein [Chloroflexota bacterium]
MKFGLVLSGNKKLKVKASTLVSRGLQALNSTNSAYYAADSIDFLSSVGGIPSNTSDPRLQNINDKLKSFFSQMSIAEIIQVLEHEVAKRPNGRVLKLLGFAYFHSGEMAQAISTLNRSLSISKEDPVAIYEKLGKANILLGEMGEAKKWFRKSYRYDFRYFNEKFGWKFLFVTSMGNARSRPPVFGGRRDDFAEIALQYLMRADALSMVYGYKRGHKSLMSIQQEQMMIQMANSFQQNRKLALDTINEIRAVSDYLYQCLEENKPVRISR